MARERVLSVSLKDCDVETNRNKRDTAVRIVTLRRPRTVPPGWRVVGPWWKRALHRLHAPGAYVYRAVIPTR